MAGNEELLVELADAVLDDRPVDWTSAESTADPADRRIVDQLKVLAAIISLHRSLSSPLATALYPHSLEGQFADADVTGCRIGPYRLERRIGVGGMGAVYEARRDDGSFERTVALKIVRPDLSTQATLERFHTERQILADLDHPGIAKLYDGGNVDGVPYFVMELVTGSTLDEFCLDKALSLAERLELVSRVCDALGHAHAEGIVHRDIKPSNVLCSPGGTPKLVDFGIAQHSADRGTADVEAGEIGFTKSYASPEQVCFLPSAPTTDVYSLGVVLYELVAGRKPYEVREATFEELRRIICESAPAPPTEVRAVDAEGSKSRPHSRGLRRKIPRPRDLDAVILKALAKEPSNRYPTASELGADLDAYLRGMPVAARRGVRGYRVTSFLRTHRRQIAVAGMLAAVVLAAIFFGPARGPTIVGPQPTEVRVVASSPWTERDGALSPDGRVAAFVADNGGVERVWCDTLDGGPSRPLTDAYERLEDPTWAPSGEEVAYLLYEEGSATIHFTSVDGTPMRSPVGVGSTADAPGLVRWLGENLYLIRAGSLWRLDVAGSDFERLTPPNFAFRLASVDVDPTETRIVFGARHNGNDDIFVANLDGSAAAPTSATPSREYRPRFRTSQRVVFLSNRSGQLGVWETDLVSGATTSVISNAERAVGVGSSADGSSLLIETALQESHLWIVDVRELRSKQLTADLLNDYTAQFVDHQNVLFHRSKSVFPLGFPLGDTEVRVAQIDELQRGAAGELLTSGFSATLAPDRRWFTFLRLSSTSSAVELWAMDRVSGREVLLSSTFAPPAYRLVPFEWESRHAAVDTRTETAYFVTRNPQGSALNGKVLPAEAGGRDRGETIIIPPAKDVRLSDVHISPGGGAIALTRASPESSEIVVLSLTSGEARIWHASDGRDSLRLLGWQNASTLIVLAPAPSPGPPADAKQLPDRVSAPDHRGRFAVSALSIDHGIEDMGFIEPLSAGGVMFFAPQNALVYTTASAGIADVAIRFLDEPAPLRLGLSGQPGVSYAGFDLAAEGLLLYSRQLDDRNLTLFRLAPVRSE